MLEMFFWVGSAPQHGVGITLEQAAQTITKTRNNLGVLVMSFTVFHEDKLKNNCLRNSQDTIAFISITVVPNVEKSNKR